MEAALRGVAAPPIKTDEELLILYHGVSKGDMHYRVGAVLTSLKDPTETVARTIEPILEPEMPYEKFWLC